MITLATLVMLVRGGQFLMAVGASPAGGAPSASARSILELCATIVGFAGLGAAWMMRNAQVQGADLFYLATVLIAGAAAASAAAERSRPMVGPILGFIIAAAAFPTAARWTWFGWMQYGSVDAAGAGPIHVLAGAAALGIAWLLGPRQGKYRIGGSVDPMPGHAVPLKFFGLILMFIGWIPYVTGATLIYLMSRRTGQETQIDYSVVVGTALNALLAVGAAVIVGAAGSYQRFGRIDPNVLGLSMLGGMVCVTAGTAGLKPGAAMAVGGVAGLLVPVVATIIETKLRIDDPLSAAATHGAGGVWALVAAAVFSPTTEPRLVLLGHQLLIAAVCAGLGFAAVAILGIGDLAGGLRRPDEAWPAAEHAGPYSEAQTGRPPS